MRFATLMLFGGLVVGVNAPAQAQFATSIGNPYGGNGTFIGNGGYANLGSPGYYGVGNGYGSNSFGYSSYYGAPGLYGAPVVVAPRPLNYGYGTYPGVGYSAVRYPAYGYGGYSRGYGNGYRRPIMGRRFR